jgi:predicted acetyltransferase
LDDRAETDPVDPRFMTFIVRVDGWLAGFAILRRCPAVDGSGEVTDMEQFFVMRKYRRQAVGEAAATTLFDRHPGRWQMRERHNNLAAQAFWRAVIGRYTGGQFDDDPGEGERGAVQFFIARRA